MLSHLFTALAIFSVATDGARVKPATTQIDRDAQNIAGECPRTIAEVDEPLQTHFDAQRVQMGLLSASELDDPNFDLSTGSAETCTKKDVCLLMRQLDMDFYQRARAGTLTDMDFDTPPDVSWMTTGTCSSAEKNRGKRYKPVTDVEQCAAKLQKEGVFPAPEHISSDEYPEGCIIVKDNNKGTKKGMINSNANSPAKAGHFTSGGSFHGHEVDYYVSVLCEHDRSLSEAASVYYSPYKLKPSMMDRPQMSTACSFGMYAYLATLKETKSSCAKILTYQTSPRFYSAQDALDQAQVAEAKGQTELAQHIRAYVDEIRSKFVLIDTIANKWCPSVWNEAMASRGTCAVPRKSSWASNGSNRTSFIQLGNSAPRRGGRAATVKGGLARRGNADRLDLIGKMIDEYEDEFAENLAGDPVEAKSVPPAQMADGKPVKMAISESFCAGMEDETLASILAGAPQAPPDFFRDASVPDGEHPSLATEEIAKWVKLEK